MSVDTTGPKGYEYQYNVTVLIALLKLEQGNELYVEKVGSEDATLIMDDEVLEIQMKREQSELNMNKFVEWICHFQERKSDNNLLYRLQTDKKTTALFISKSRCSDEISPFIKPISNLDRHFNFRIKKDWKISFAEALKTFSKFGKKTTLAKERNLFCEKQGEHFQKQTLGNIKSTLQKISIWEQASDELINETIKDLLNKKYHIPLSRVDEVFHLLNDEVKKGRDEKNDIFPSFRKILIENKAEAPQLDKSYIFRNEETILLQKIENENILFLTGLSHCGKSQIAKKIAYSFFEKGYSYKTFSKIHDTRIFLNSNSLDLKIAIIDDPFGHVERLDDFSETKEELKALIDNIPPDNKVIVTSRKEILLDSFEEENIKDCSIKGHGWNDLTMIDPNYLLDIFRQLPDRQKKITPVIDAVESGLKNSTSKDILQVGELIYLLNLEDSLENLDFGELERIARSQVKSIVTSIKTKSDETVTKILATLSMCGNTITPIPLSELAFALSEKEEAFLKENNSDSRSRTIVFGGRREDSKIEFPSKTNDYILDKKIEEAIDYLEERRFITYSDDEGSIIFTHPNYFEAGRFLFINRAKNKQNDLLRIYRRCLFSLLPNTAFHATQQIPIFYKEVKERHRQSIVDLSFLLLRSLFPNVEDFNLIFLIEKLDELLENKSNQENITKLIYKTTEGSTHSRMVYWNDDKTPYISYKGSFFDNLLFTIDEDILDETETELKSGNLVSAYNTWNYIKCKEVEKAQIIDTEIIKTILQSSEAFIRKEIIDYCLTKTPIADKIIVKTIFNDKHPDVVFTAIHTCLNYWNIYTEVEKTYLLDLIVKSVSKKSVGVRAFNFVTTFGKDYTNETIKNWRDLTAEEKKELWKVWSLIFPTVLGNHKLNPRLNAPRFSATMSDATEFVDKHSYMKLATSWYERIESQLQEEKMLSTFELGITNNILKVSGQDSEVRKGIFEKLLSYPKTGFLLVNLVRTTWHWEEISLSERDFIFKLIESDREDVRWIKAVLLCVETPPEEIVGKITGDKKLFSKSAAEIISTLRPQLLKNCLNVFTGHPHPLGWYAVHHCNYDLWKKIMKHILIHEDKNHLEICLEDFLGSAVTSFTDKNYTESVWTETCRNSKDRPFLTKQLVYYISQSSINYTCTKILFDILLEAAKKDKKEKEVISTIAENIELLQQTGHKEDVFRIFDEVTFNKIVEDINPDITIARMLEMFAKNQFMEQELINQGVEMILKMIEEIPIRFFPTFTYIEKKAAKLNLPDHLFKALTSIPNKIKIVGEAEKEKIDKLKNYKLENWLGVH